MYQELFKKLKHWQQGNKKAFAAVLAAIVVVSLMFLGLLWSIFSEDNDQFQSGASSSSSRPSAQWHLVQNTSFDQIVLATGELAAEKQIEVKCKVEGGTSIVELVDEGVTVRGPRRDDKGNILEPGQVIARLADDRIKEKLEQALLEVERARAEQVAAVQFLAIQENESKNLERAATVKLQQAQLTLSKWLQGDDPQKQRELALALEKAVRTLSRANEDCELSRQLFAENFIAKSELDNDELKAIEAQSALETARLNLEVYEKYTRPKELQGSQSDVDQARNDLEKTIKKNESDLARLRADLENKTRALRIREMSLAKQQDQLANTVIRAPQDGILIYATSINTSGGSMRGGRDPISMGRSVNFNETLFYFPDTTRLNAVLRVHEAMLSQIKREQKVTIAIDALPGRSFEGTVEQIAVTPEDGGWMNPDLREYRVTVRLPAELDNLLKPAMRCTGRVFIGRVENALAVPVQSVLTEQKRNYVYVQKSSSSVQQRWVTIGRMSESWVEVTQGLEPGEKILVRRPHPGETIQKTKPPTTN